MYKKEKIGGMYQAKHAGLGVLKGFSEEAETLRIIAMNRSRKDRLFQVGPEVTELIESGDLEEH